ncbi:MAG: pyridoxal phosphate-dependent aminotransferase [Acidobacteriota bacterium]|nr:pyridoxal phosphate-dependent aminotransferase [Acidobacteriota bacterium]
MFSSRFHWDFRPNRLTLALAARRAEEREVLDLTESNPTHAGLAYPDDVTAAFSGAGLLAYEPAPAGAPAAREAVSEYYRARGCAVGIERILLTASTSEAYAYLFKLLADPGDEVLVPRPSYPLFEFLAAMENVTVRPYSLVYHGTWGIDLAGVEAAIGPRTRAIVLVNPNNPTGSYVKRAELDELARMCRARGIALVSDEVFSDYALTGDPRRVSTLAGVDECLAFSMSGLSKVAGLPQMKLGWIVASGPAAARREALEKLEWIADTYLSVGTPVQCAAARLLAAGEAVQRQIRERTARHLDFARNTLAGSPANLLHVEGGWYAILQVPRIRGEEEWALDLLARGVLVQPGFFYDFESEAYLVVSLLTGPAIFQEGMARLRDALV